MPPKQPSRIVLSAGEECALGGSGAVHIALQTGVLEVAGAQLEANRSYTFYVSSPKRVLIVSTLEGGSATVQSATPIEMHKYAKEGAGTLVQLARRTLLPLDKSKVLVIGKAGSGKTLAAHTICNLIKRYGSEVDDRGVPCSAFLLDLNAESNSIYCPGCVSLVQVAPEQPAPLWAGNTSAPTLLPLPFFTGIAARPSTADVSVLLHFGEQLNETATAYAQEVCGSTRCHVVIDAPTPLTGLEEGVFYRKLVEILRPTHVLIVGGSKGMEGGAQDWSNFLEKDVQRILPDCRFFSVASVGTVRAESDKTLLMQEYFVGSPYSPLGCSKVVVPIHAFHFVELTYSEHGGAVGVQKVSPDSQWRLLVCALSHAEIVEEVPLAPVAGLIVISYVDEAHDEVVLIIPANVEDVLRRCIIVPSQRERETLRLTDVQVATMEESLAV